jgi:two-component system, NtrC family, nitrogen regulation response regulator NtrX
MALDILVVDDERDIRDLVAGVLEDEGYTARTGASYCSTYGCKGQNWTG